VWGWWVLWLVSHIFFAPINQNETIKCSKAWRDHASIVALPRAILFYHLSLQSPGLLTFAGSFRDCFELRDELRLYKDLAKENEEEISWALWLRAKARCRQHGHRLARNTGRYVYVPLLLAGQNPTYMAANFHAPVLHPLEHVTTLMLHGRQIQQNIRVRIQYRIFCGDCRTHGSRK